MQDPLTSDFIEMKLAAQWWAQHLSSDRISEQQRSVFEEKLHQSIVERCRGHWYPCDSLRGSAYRSISNDFRVDPMLFQAATAAGIFNIKALLPNATIWVDPGFVKVKGDNPPYTSILHDVKSMNCCEIRHETCFSIWVRNIIDEMGEDLEALFSSFGLLCNSSCAKTTPIQVHGHSHFGNKGALVHFINFEDARAALEACGSGSVLWGLHRSRAIQLVAKPVGNTSFLLNLLRVFDGGCPAPSVSFARAAEVCAAADGPPAGDWLDLLRRHPALFKLDETRKLIEPCRPAASPARAGTPAQPALDASPGERQAPPPPQSKGHNNAGALPPPPPPPPGRPRCDGGHWLLRREAVRGP